MMELSLDLPHWAAIFGNWLYDWQTLIGAGLALVAAYWAGRGLNHQIRQQERLHDESRRSRFAVARAKAPLAAVEIADHAQTYLAQTEALLPLVFTRSRDRFEFDGPEFPAEASRILDTLVENSDDTILIEQVSALYSEHQVMASRMKSARPVELSLCIDDYFLQPIMIDAIAMNLLAFGRDGLEPKALSWEDIEVRAKSLLRNATSRDRVLAYIADKKERKRPVPLALRRHNDR
jgi:hypothetical protein